MKARVDGERLPRGANRATHTKLGRGGLADVEWTVQLLTLQHCHRIPTLHNTSTLEVLEEIRTAGLLSEFDVVTLQDAWITASEARNALVLSKAKIPDQLPPPRRPAGARRGRGGLGSGGLAGLPRQLPQEDPPRPPRRGPSVLG